MKKILLTLGCVILLFGYIFMDIGVINGNSGQNLSLWGIAINPDSHFAIMGSDFKYIKYSFWSPLIFFESPIQFLFRYGMVVLILCLGLILFTTFQNKSVFFIKYQKEIVLLSGLISTLMVVFTLLSLNRVMIIYLEAEGRPDILKLMILPIGLIFIIAGFTQEK